MSSPGATRDDLLPIGDVAARSGLAPSAIRFYEAEGLIRAERTDSGRRAFPRHVLRRLAFISSAQRVGLSLKEIADALATLPPTGRRPRRSGRHSPVAGADSSTSGSPSSNGCATTSRPASDVAACRCRPASCSTPTTRPPRTAPGRDTS
jgi:DNA-binding transcriptional MerR regulator